MLLAYEHGSQAPDAFLRFDLGACRSVRLRAVKGNYWRGQVVDAQHPYETVWMQAGLVAGDEDTAAEAYRRFVRVELAAEAPLQPRVHYNTWNFQERNKWWNGKKYLDSMNAERMLAEIDVAAPHGDRDVRARHRLVREDRRLGGEPRALPGGARADRKKLDGYGMKLGLWFDPSAAAVSSRAYLENRGNVLSTGGKTQKLAGVGDGGELPDVPRLAVGRDVPARARAAREGDGRHVLQVGRGAAVRLRRARARPRRGVEHGRRRGATPTPSASRCASPRSPAGWVRRSRGRSSTSTSPRADAASASRSSPPAGTSSSTTGRTTRTTTCRSTSRRTTGTSSSTRARRAPGSRARRTGTTSGSRRSSS